MRVSLVLAASLAVLAGGQARATIVNVDATSSVGSTISLAAGTYAVTYAGIAGGGLYDGYSLAMNNYGTPSATPTRFTDELAISLGAATNFNTSATYDYVPGGVQQGYATAAQALSAYQVALATGQLGYSTSYAQQNYSTMVSQITFSLATAGQVTFTAPDNAYWDDTGGVSVNVTKIAEPASAALLAAGLIGFGIIARRRRAQL